MPEAERRDLDFEVEQPGEDDLPERAPWLQHLLVSAYDERFPDDSADSLLDDDGLGVVE